MPRNCRSIGAVLVVSLGVLLARPALAASATQVTRSAWAGSASLPSYLQMYVYVPAKMAANPPIVVSAHSCGSSASSQVQNIPKTLAAADAQGFIVILPDNPNQNCWDVGTTPALTHDGGSDTYGVALMVKYALMKYGGDPNRVYIFGGSSGAMLTQAMCAVYPDIFRACSARAGVPAGCWAVGYDSTMQWSNSCANGQVSKTAQQWGDQVRMMYPGYTGHRPRMQTFQGESDTTISYNNTGESIKQWTNVLGLGTSPITRTQLVLLRIQVLLAAGLGVQVLEQLEAGVHAVGRRERCREHRADRERARATVHEVLVEDVRRIGEEVRAKIFLHLALRQFGEILGQLLFRIPPGEIGVRLREPCLGQCPHHFGPRERFG